MSIIKQLKDYTIKILWNEKSVPLELFELSQYFRNNGPVHFDYKKENGEIIAVSKDFRHGSIITSATTEKQLDKNIKDAILTAFDVPSSYKNEAGLHRVGQEDHVYAVA